MTTQPLDNGAKNGRRFVGLLYHEWFNKITLGVITFFAIFTFNMVQQNHRELGEGNVKMERIETQMKGYDARILRIEDKQDDHDTKWTELYKNSK